VTTISACASHTDRTSFRPATSPRLLALPGSRSRDYKNSETLPNSPALANIGQTELGLIERPSLKSLCASDYFASKCRTHGSKEGESGPMAARAKWERCFGAKATSEPQAFPNVRVHARNIDCINSMLFAPRRSGCNRAELA